MSDPKDPYPLEPGSGDAPAPTPSDLDDTAVGVPAPVPPDSGKPKPRLLADRLLDDFEEDADFTADPELDKALGKKPVSIIPAEAGR